MCSQQQLSVCECVFARPNNTRRYKFSVWNTKPRLFKSRRRCDGEIEAWFYEKDEKNEKNFESLELNSILHFLRPSKCTSRFSFTPTLFY